MDDSECVAHTYCPLHTSKGAEWHQPSRPTIKDGCHSLTYCHVFCHIRGMVHWMLVLLCVMDWLCDESQSESLMLLQWFRNSVSLFNELSIWVIVKCGSRTENFTISRLEPSAWWCKSANGEISSYLNTMLYMVPNTIAASAFVSYLMVWFMGWKYTNWRCLYSLRYFDCKCKLDLVSEKKDDLIYIKRSEVWI